MRTERRLGIDLRVCAVKVAQVARTPQGEVLEKFGQAEIPLELLNSHPEREAAQARAIKEILNRQNITTKKAVIVAGGREVLVKKITLPELSAADLKEAVELQVDKLTDQPLDELVYDFIPVNGKKPAPGPRDYLVAVAKREVLDRFLEVGRLAGLKIVSVTILPLALKKAFWPDLTDVPTALVYLGKRSTDLSIFVQRRFAFNRDIALGGELITQAMTGVVGYEQGKVELSHDQAESLKVKSGVPLEAAEYSRQTGIPADQLFAMVRPALEKLEAEFLRSFEFFGSKPERVIVTGGSANTPHLLDSISRAVKLPVERGVPRINGEAASDRELPALAGAIGAALMFGEKINLLSGRAWQFWPFLKKLLRNIWTITLIYLMILLVLWSTVAAQLKQARGLQANFRRLSTAQGLPVEAFTESDKIIQRLNPGNKALFRFNGVVKALDQLTPDSIYYSTIKYDNKADLLLINGVIAKGPGSSVAADYIDKLNQTGLFTSIDLLSLTETKRYTVTAYEFQLKCRVASGVDDGLQ